MVIIVRAPMLEAAEDAEAGVAEEANCADVALDAGGEGDVVARGEGDGGAGEEGDDRVGAVGDGGDLLGSATVVSGCAQHQRVLTACDWRGLAALL